MNDQLFNELKQKYESELREDYEKYSNYRKAGGWVVGIIFGFIFSIWILMFTGISGFGSPILILLPIGLLVVSVYKLISYGKKGKGGSHFNEYYMKTVIQDILSRLYTDVNCYTLFENPDLRMAARDVYNESGFDRSYDSFHCYSEINMKYDGRDLAVYDLHTEERQEDSDGDTTYVTTFKGLYGIMTLKHNFNAEIHVDKRGFNYNRIDKVNMDSVNFNKEFKVLASDKVLAMQLLTHDVMDRILELANSIGKIKFEFRILNDKMYFRIFNYNTFNHDGKELFDRNELDNDYINAKLFRDIMDIIEKSVTDNNIIE